MRKTPGNGHGHGKERGKKSFRGIESDDEDNSNNNNNNNNNNYNDNDGKSENGSRSGSSSANVTPSASPFPRSNNLAGDASSQSELTLLEEIKDAVNDLTENKSAVREKAMSKLTQIMKKSYVSDHLLSYRETLVDGLKRCLQKSSEREAAAVCLSVAFVTLGPDGSEGLFSEIEQVCRESLKDFAPPSLAYLLAVAAFVGSDEEEDNAKVSSLFLDLIEKTTGELQVACISAFGLVGIEYDEGFRRCLSVLKNANSDLNSKLAAGECALLLSNNVSDIDQDDLYATLLECASEYDRHVSKQERQQQRAGFRGLVEYFERKDDDENPPSETLVIGRKKIVLTGLDSISRMSFFRHLLEGGLNVHLAQNPFLIDLFHLESFTEERKLTREEKKALQHSPITKENDQSRKGDKYRKQQRNTNLNGYDSD